MRSYFLIVKLLLVALVCFSANGILKAQQHVGTEVMVFCLDKSIYRGELISETKSELFVKILSTDTIKIKRENIRKVRYGVDHIFHPGGGSHQRRGFFWGLNAGFGISKGGDDIINSVNYAELLLGKRIREKLSVGLSLSMQSNYFEIENSNVIYSQAFGAFSFHGRYYLNNKKIRPFLLSQIGYGVGAGNSGVSESFTGGFTTQNGLGIHLSSKRTSRIIISLVHLLQHTKGDGVGFDQNNGFRETDVKFNFWTSMPLLRIGFELR